MNSCEDLIKTDVPETLCCNCKESVEIHSVSRVVQYAFLLDRQLTHLVALSGTVFIDRANRTSALKTFDNAVKQMKQKNVPFHPLNNAYIFSKVYGSSLKEHDPTPTVQ